MAKLLYIQGSPRAQRSKSRRAAQELVDAYLAKHPQTQLDVLDLANEPLPEMDELAAGGKYAIMHGQPFTPEQKAAWSEVERVIDRFKSADLYVLAVPMWNFGIPYRLKHYFDLVVQPGYTFSVTAEGEYRGLLSGKRAVAVYARGGAYVEPDSLQLDHQKPYVELILGFMGIGPVESIVIEPTLAGGPEVAQTRLGQAIDQARDLAGRL